MTDADLDAIVRAWASDRIGTHWDGCHLVHKHHDCAILRLVAEIRRLREALTWAVGFIRCNSPGAEANYPDMRNACDLVNAYGVMYGEFQRCVARAELAEDDVRRQRALNMELAERLAACSSVLGRAAERGKVCECQQTQEEHHVER